MSKDRFGDSYIEYVLGSLSEAESAAFRQHLESCPECRANIRELEELVHCLPHALPQVEPPARLKEQILQRVAGTAGPLLRSIPTRAALTAGPWRTLTALAASLFLVAVAASIYFYRESQQSQKAMRYLQAEREDLGPRVEALRTELERLRAENQRLNTVVQEITAQSVSDFLTMAGLKTYGEVKASAFIQADHSKALIFFHNLPALPPDRDFQVWVIERDIPPHPSRVFHEVSGSEQIEIRLPVEASRVQKLALTIEPRGGSPQPTGPMVAAGDL